MLSGCVSENTRPFQSGGGEYSFSLAISPFPGEQKSRWQFGSCRAPLSGHFFKNRFERKGDEQMIYTVQLALVCAALASAIATAALLLYRKWISKPAEVQPSMARIREEK
jgi:hypothetical protein